MSDELFPVNPTPLPPLELARRKLGDAIVALAEAEQTVWDQGPEGEPIMEVAVKRKNEAAAEVLRLEREAWLENLADT